MSQIETQILYQDYVLTCPDGQEAQLLEAVERVEQQFEQMRDKSKLRSRERVGVLLAVNLAYENLELRKQLQALQTQLVHVQATDDEDDTDTDLPVVEAVPVDTERMEQLEHIAAQYATDLMAAQQLISRLDEVLAQQVANVSEDAPAEPITAENAITEHNSQLALTDSDTQAQEASDLDSASAAPTTNLDNHNDVELLANAVETR